MTKKIKLLAFSALFLFFSSNAFCTGAGIQIGKVPGIGFVKDGGNSFALMYNVTGTLRFSRLPMTVGAGITARPLGTYHGPLLGFSAFADYYILDVQAKNTWSIFSGIGVSGRVIFSLYNFTPFPEAGIRLFAGSSWTFWDGYLELHTQLNVTPSLLFKDDGAEFRIEFPLEVGLRWHF